MKKSIRRCEIVCNLADKNNHTLWDMDKMQAVLNEKAHVIKDWAYIIHDKDTYTEQDETNNPDHKAGSLKPAHIHLLLRFHSKQPQNMENVAKWFNIAPNFVEKIKGRWEDAVLYLAHLNAPDKYQYDLAEVQANFDIQAAVTRAKQVDDLDTILLRIINGEIREYNKTLEIDNLMLVNEARKINEAFKIRAEHLQATMKDRRTEVIYITGSSGCGKTTLAKQIAGQKGLDYFISSGSNDIMDGYGQQPCLIIDDIRPSAMGLSDFLKMLDNNTACSVKSRYRNKFLNAELIIITSVLEIGDFYSHVFENEQEPITQLKRRCGTYIRMNRDCIATSVWDPLLLDYTPPVYAVNDVWTQFVTAPKTRADAKARMMELLPTACLLNAAPPMIHGSKAKQETEIISDAEFEQIGLEG